MIRSKWAPRPDEITMPINSKIYDRMFDDFLATPEGKEAYRSRRWVKLDSNGVTLLPEAVNSEAHAREIVAQTQWVIQVGRPHPRSKRAYYPHPLYHPRSQPHYVNSNNGNSNHHHTSHNLYKHPAALSAPQSDNPASKAVTEETEEVAPQPKYDRLEDKYDGRWVFSSNKGGVVVPLEQATDVDEAVAEAEQRNLGAGLVLKFGKDTNDGQPKPRSAYVHGKTFR